MEIKLTPPVLIERVRYIKLGAKGVWAEECIANNTVRLGFRTEKYLDLCQGRDWEALKRRYLVEEGATPGVATNRCKQVKAYFEDDGSTLWITFHNRLLWWTVIDPLQLPTLAADQDGMQRKTKFKWRETDLKQHALHMNELSGKVTKFAAFLGAGFEVTDSAIYVIRRVNGEKSPEALKAEKLSEELKDTVCLMMKMLTPQDFELLVDLIFSTSGWRRLGAVGGPVKLVDMELELPTTGERAFVQVKSRTTQREFEKYKEILENMGYVSRMFYAFHTGAVTPTDNRVTILNADALSQMVLDAGLVSWLIKRTS